MSGHLYFALGLLVGVLIGVAIPRSWIRRLGRKTAPKRQRLVRDHLVGIVMVAVLASQILAGLAVVGFGVAWHRLDGAVSTLQNQRDELKADEARLKTTETRQKTQIDCQATVNANLIATLHDRSTASREAVLAPRAFFKILFPILTAPQLTPAQLAALTPAQRHQRELHQHQVLERLIVANHAANEAYQHYLDSQQANPLPPLPTTTCGDKPKKGP